MKRFAMVWWRFFGWDGPAGPFFSGCLAAAQIVALLALLALLSGCGGCFAGREYIWESSGQHVCLDP